MKIPNDLPTGIQKTLRLLEKAVKSNSFAVMETGDPSTGERSFAFGSVEKDEKGNVVGVRLLAELSDSDEAEAHVETITVEKASTHKYGVVSPKVRLQ